MDRKQSSTLLEEKIGEGSLLYISFISLYSTKYYMNVSINIYYFIANNNRWMEWGSKCSDTAIFLHGALLYDRICYTIYCTNITIQTLTTCVWLTSSVSSWRWYRPFVDYGGTKEWIEVHLWRHPFSLPHWCGMSLV